MWLTHRNHFKFGFNDKAFMRRQKPEDQWRVEYGVCERPPLSFGEECREAARLLHQRAGSDIWVLFSGGIDSEVVMRSFVAAGIRVRAAILRFKHDLNRHDITYAYRACSELDVPYETFDLDVEDFFLSGKFWEYAEISNCVTPQFLPTMWCLERIPGFPILGSGECLLVRRRDERYSMQVGQPYFSNEPYEASVEMHWDLWEKEKVASFYFFLLATQKEGCAGFFQYTPEIMAAYLLDARVRDMVASPRHSSSAADKFAIYQQHFPQLQNRLKYTGYENLMELDQTYRQQLMARFPFGDAIYRTEYYDLSMRLTNGCEVARGDIVRSGREARVRASDLVVERI